MPRRNSAVQFRKERYASKKRPRGSQRGLSPGDQASMQGFDPYQ